MQEPQEMQVRWEDSLEEDMVTHCSILAWRIPRTEEPGGLQSIGPDLSSVLTEKKKMHSLKLRIMFYLADNTEDLSLGHSLSGSSVGLLQRGKGEAKL